MPDFETALQNIYVYLRPGGLLRVLVPDLNDYIEGYREEVGDGATASEAAPAFMTLTGLACEGTRRSLGARLREALSNSRHQTMWDEPSLTAALARHGFTNIRSCGYGGWGDERFAAVELEIRHGRSICLEATK